MKAIVLKSMTILRDAVMTFAAAASAATAVENHQQPSKADLRQLGIEGARFKLNY